MNKKDLLAKLLSTENITIVRQPVQTASFNIETRVLTLPVWKNLSENIENMLIAHEVGHALYTPFRDKDCEEFNQNKLLHSWANVIEDVRIEKNIQKEYPGLKKDFIAAYKELVDKNFFGAKGRDLAKEQFINKANLFYKAGYNCGVKFTTEEYSHIKEMDKCETFDDVMVLARKLTAYSIAKNEQEKEALEKLAALYLKEGDGDELSENLKDSLKNSFIADKDDIDSLEDKTGMGESAPNLRDTDSYKPTMQDNFNRMLSNHTSNNEFIFIDHTSEFIGFDPYVSYKTYISDVDKWLSYKKIDQDNTNKNIIKTGGFASETYEDKMKKGSLEFKTYLQDIKKEVNYLIKEFEMRKSANQYYRTKEHKTGNIDIRKLASYKIKEEIFKTIQSLPKGKNHGMVMLMDWSGSMNYILSDIIRQVYLMTSFCKIANIPFTVLAFTNGLSENSPIRGECAAQRIKELGNSSEGLEYGQDPTKVKPPEMPSSKLDVEPFKLVEILSNKMNKDEYNKMGALLFSEVYKNISDYKLASTPLNESLLYMVDFLPKFKKLNNVQKLSFIVLTDGEGHSLYPRRFHNMMHDKKRHLYLRKNNKEYTYKSFMQVGSTIKMIKDIDPNITCLAFSLIGDTKRHISSILTYLTSYTLGTDQGRNYVDSDDAEVIKISKDFKELGASALKQMNEYDEYYLIPLKNVKVGLSDVDELNSLQELSASKIAKKFTKFLEKNRNSRFLLNSLAKQVA